MYVPLLELDPELKIWVLIPISIVMVIIGLLRSNITALLQPLPKLEDFNVLKEKVLAFKANNEVLTREEFESRKKYLLEKLHSTEFYAQEPNTEAPANPFSDPGTGEMINNMAKGNLMNFIPQTLIMGWVNYFFAGFVVMRLPFPLTNGFKSMLQTGIATPDLDVRYVSSISWYFVNLFGLRPVYSLLAGQGTADAIMQQQQLQQQPLPNIGGPGGPKVDKIFLAEADNIHILSHESIFDGIEQRILQKFTSEI